MHDSVHTEVFTPHTVMVSETRNFLPSVPQVYEDEDSEEAVTQIYKKGDYIMDSF